MIPLVAGVDLKHYCDFANTVWRTIVGRMMERRRCVSQGLRMPRQPESLFMRLTAPFRLDEKR